MEVDSICFILNKIVSIPIKNAIYKDIKWYWAQFNKNSIEG